MNLTIECAQFHALLSRVSRVVETSDRSPIMTRHMLLVADGDRLTATATNGEMLASGSCAAEIDLGGSISVPGERLAAIVASMPLGAQLSMALKDDRLTIKTGRSRFTLNTMPAHLFADWTDRGNLEGTSIGAKTLAGLLAFAAPFATDQADPRFNLAGVNLHEIERDGCRFFRSVATDGKKLALSDLKVAHMPEALLSSRSVKEIRALLDKTDGEVLISSTKTQFSMRMENGTSFFCKLIDAEFPSAYQMIVAASAESPNTVNVDGRAFASALTRLKSMAKSQDNGVRIEIGAGILKASVKNPEHGDASDEIECEYDGPPILTGFTIVYATDALAALDADTIRIAFSDDGRPTLWQAVGDDDRMIVVVPRVGDV